MVNKQNTAQLKLLLSIFSVVSLAFDVLCRSSYFVEYIFSHRKVELIFVLPNMARFACFVVGILPHILLVVYILAFYSKAKAPELIPIIFGSVAFANLVFFVLDLRGFALVGLLFDLPMVVAFTLATISALRGFRKKGLLIAAIAVGALIEALYLTATFVPAVESWLEDERYFYILTSLSGVLGRITLYITLLLIGLKSKPHTASPEKEPIINNMQPDEALRLLNDKLDLGIINEEQYQAQRAEIISRL